MKPLSKGSLEILHRELRKTATPPSKLPPHNPLTDTRVVLVGLAAKTLSTTLQHIAPEHLTKDERDELLAELHAATLEIKLYARRIEQGTPLLANPKH